MRVVVVNQNAKGMRDPRRLQAIRCVAHGYAEVLTPSSVEDMMVALTELAYRHHINDLYVVGGDGTFHQALNWVLRQPADRRPALMSVGGGEICYMARRCGFKSMDAVKNLAFALRHGRTVRQWQPLKMEDSLFPSRPARYAAIIANGIVSDFIAWYEEVGKGSMRKVVWMILQVAVLVLVSDRLRRWHGRLGAAHGTVDIDHVQFRKPSYNGLVIGSIDHILPGCRPFLRTRFKNEVSLLMHWGGLRSLALALPWVFRGRVPRWIELDTYNMSAKKITITTRDDRLTLDGDLVQLKTPPAYAGERTLTITAGPFVDLLMVT